ncbi:hypothetical protein NSMS1_31940 [Nostoc sp. MS1]|nr:hypothetical protein NSMS1_31940 [Nostoc sp. MS1]
MKPVGLDNIISPMPIPKVKVNIHEKKPLYLSFQIVKIVKVTITIAVKP